jgi:hypothetical protein
VIIRAVVAVLGGAALLIWTALFNGYPLLFSDSGGFLHQTLGPLMLWDKPYIYGPFLHAFHLRISLWGPVIAQGLILSHLLWLMQRAVCARATPLWHIGLCAFAALATAAPFSAALLMPDIFAPIVVLGLFLLGFGGAALSRWEQVYLVFLVALGASAAGAWLMQCCAAAAALALSWADFCHGLAGGDCGCSAACHQCHWSWAACAFTPWFGFFVGAFAGRWAGQRAAKGALP